MMLHYHADELLAQLKNIIHQLKDGHFSKPVPVLSQATLGQHIRHTIEFFLCLMHGHAEGHINYDHRKHDVLIERDPQLALHEIEEIRDFIRKEATDFPLQLEANYSLEHDSLITMPSSFYRELAYNIEHTIHHMALLKVALNDEFTYVQLPEHFGVASSTVRFQYQKQA
jgi:hypothetical protein